MEWILIVGFTAAFQGSAVTTIGFETAELCREAEVILEAEWDVDAICLRASN